MKILVVLTKKMVPTIFVFSGHLDVENRVMHCHYFAHYCIKVEAGIEEKYFCVRHMAIYSVGFLGLVVASGNKQNLRGRTVIVLDKYCCSSWTNDIIWMGNLQVKLQFRLIK